MRAGSATPVWLETKAPTVSLNARLQSLRIAAFRVRRSGESTPLPPFVEKALSDAEPRVRFEAVQAIWQSRQKKLVDRLWTLTATESDRITFYSAWQALRSLASVTELKRHLGARQDGVRRAALLALLKRRAAEGGGDEIHRDRSATAGTRHYGSEEANSLIAADPHRGFRGRTTCDSRRHRPAALRVRPTAGAAARCGRIRREGVQH
jgi:hypothetical protein